MEVAWLSIPRGVSKYICMIEYFAIIQMYLYNITMWINLKNGVFSQKSKKHNEIHS